LQEKSDGARRSWMRVTRRDAPMNGCAYRFYPARGVWRGKSGDRSRGARLREANAPGLCVRLRRAQSSRLRRALSRVEKSVLPCIRSGG
jgi:hypothetical protein